MEKKQICLEFNPMVTRLAGFDFGEDTYREQVEKQIDFSEETTIVFPNQIIKVASSFVQGFFSEIIAQVGLEGIGSNVIVNAGSKELIASILDNLT